MTTRPTVNSVASGETASIERADGEEHTGDDRGAPPADPVGGTACDERAEEGAERDPTRDDLALERGEVEVGAEERERPRDDALVVAEQKSGEEGDDADAEDPRRQSAVGLARRSSLVTRRFHLRWRPANPSRRAGSEQHPDSESARRWYAGRARSR